MNWIVYYLKLAKEKTKYFFFVLFIVLSVRLQQYTVASLLAQLYTLQEDYDNAFFYYEQCLTDYAKMIDNDFLYSYVQSYCDMETKRIDYKDSYKLGIGMIYRTIL